MEKEYSITNAQLHKLRSRGLIISNGSRAKRIIELEVENNVKSVLAHDFSRKYGHDNYLKVSYFDTSVKRWERKTSVQKVGEVSDLISNLHHEIARQLSKNNPMISHYMLEYGYVLLWVLVNTLTLGTISTFYSYLKQKEQNALVKNSYLSQKK